MSDYLRRHYRGNNLFIGFIILAGLCVWLFPDPASALRRKTSTNRECAICHVMWLDEFKRKDVKPLIPFDPLPVVATGKQDVASTEQMCFSCHDGFALDSRFKWKKNRFNHPVGVKPSDDVTIPTSEGKTVFPLNKDGKIYCGTCHSAHGVDWKEKEKAKGATLFLRIENRNSNLCIACHLNRATGSRKGNHPVNKKLEKLPAVLVKAGSQFSDNNKIICQSCHLAHGSKQKRMLVRPNHNSDLCASCHKHKANIRKTKHNMSLMAPSAKNIRGSKAGESGPCSACHIPHKARWPRLWSRPLSASKDAASAYCLDCHRSGGIADEKTIGKHSHPVNVPLKELGIVAKQDVWKNSTDNTTMTDSVKLPLYDHKGRGVKAGGNVACMTCHDPHQWSADHAQTAGADVRKLEGDGSNSFLRMVNSKDSALCKNCHRDKAAVALSKHNLDISAPDEKNKDGMTVANSGLCSACHVPHNGKGGKMWARTVNGKDISSKCKGCHAKDAVAEKKITGQYSHPLHINLKKLGGKTDLPLFNKAGQHDKDGVIDCATCHDPHQWNPANATDRSGMNVDIEGDASNSFLRKQASGNALLCVNCHKGKKTVIGTDHDLAVTSGNTLNAAKQTVKQSGPCGQCHTPHNAIMPQRLWAQHPGEGRHETEKLCTGCHSNTGAAYEKVPVELLHPSRTLSVSEGRKRSGDNINLKPPLFTGAGKKADEGMISCLTCHDPHQWDAKQHKAGSGKNREGDVSSSFLRHSSTEYFICSDCHGEDSLYRYKYFHWPKSRPKKDEK